MSNVRTDSHGYGCNSLSMVAMSARTDSHILSFSEILQTNGTRLRVETEHNAITWKQSTDYSVMQQQPHSYVGSLHGKRGNATTLENKKKNSPDALFAHTLHRFVLEEVVGKFSLYSVYLSFSGSSGVHVSYFHAAKIRPANHYIYPNQDTKWSYTLASDT